MPSNSAQALNAGSFSSKLTTSSTSIQPSDSPSSPSDSRPLPNLFAEKTFTQSRAPQPYGATVVSPPNAGPFMNQFQVVNFSSTYNRQHHQTRNYQSRKQSHSDHSNWRDYTLLALYVINLPINATTLQIWRNFKRYGELQSIVIRDNDEQHTSKRATITYKPPPATAFWERLDGVRYSHGDRTYRTVRVTVDKKQKTHFEVQSPVRPGVKYNEQNVLTGQTIDFGVMTGPTSLLVLKTRKANATFIIKFQLDLRSREIIVHFPSPVTSSNSGLVMREYRFKVALDQQFALSQLNQTENEIVLMLEVDKPPPYSKKLSTSASGSHADDARRWLVEDLWARQTDIADTKDAHTAISRSPVSVQNKFISIDISRWLAFRLVIPMTQSNKETLTMVQNALMDFNVPISQGSRIDCKVANSTDEPILWNVLDGNSNASNDRRSSALHSLIESATTLTFPVRYQLEVCVSHGYLSEYTIDRQFLSQLSSLTPPKALRFLKAVDLRGQKFLKPTDIFDDLGFRKPIKKAKIPENCVEIHHATVTATKIYFHTPSVEITNRVIRQYKQHADRFLRVRFEDDDYRGSTRLFSSVNNKMANIFTRVRRTLTHGILLDDRHYKFLAWGNSQLREHGAYFFADLPGVITASNIRAQMGEFSDEKIVAKCAARMGQCFSTTRSLSIRIPRIHQSICIPDVKTDDKKYTFTDGVGMMSDLVASMAGMQMGLKAESPSVIQFRLGGCKGVLAYDPRMNGTIDLKVRASQFKFSSASNELELIRCSSFAHADLNRQLILVLSDLGIEPEVFLKKQEKLMKEIERAMVSDDAAVKALKDRVDPNLMTPVIANMVSTGRFCTVNEPFVTSIMHLWRSWSLKYLKEKARLPIPQSAFVLGCTDETKTLRGHFDKVELSPDVSPEERQANLPEIFLQITDPITQEVQVIQGLCVLARNPSLHRGDVRVVKAVDVPELHHLRDAVVFPQTGDRDLPSMCSGGDLDGDDFIVTWDQALLPDSKHWNVPSFHYDPPVPVQADGDVTTEQIISFFVDYMENDFLGRIAHAHLAWADDKGLDSPQCLDLVQLHSLSVDFPKTGVPARMERRLERGEWPHFMEKRNSYRSHNILGKLYDSVEKVDFRPNYKGKFDTRILDALEPPQQLYQQVKILKESYDESMQQIMAQHKIKTEFEVWSTFVLDHSKKSNKYKFHEEIGRISAALKEQYFNEITALMGGKDLQHLSPFAVAAYRLTRAEVDEALGKILREERDILPAEMPFISFPWVLHDTLTKIAAGGLKEAHPDESGIRFDADGNAVLPTPTSGTSSMQGYWQGRHYTDPLQDDLASSLLPSENNAAISEELPDTKVVLVDQSKTPKLGKAVVGPDISSGSMSDADGSNAKNGRHVEEGGSGVMINREEPTSARSTFADPASDNQGLLGRRLESMGLGDSDSD